MANGNSTIDAAADRAIDTAIDIVTPENIAFRYRVAGPFRRLPAYLIDSMIRVVLGFIPFLILRIIDAILEAQSIVGIRVSPSFRAVVDWGMGLWLLIWFAMDWFYGGLLETIWNGQTPGKRLLRLRVLTVDGLPINGLQAVLRNFLRAVDAMPLLAMYPLYQLGLVASTVLDRYQRLGDWAAGTIVVVEEREWSFGVLRITEPAALQLAAQLPTGFRPSRSLAQALSRYVARRMTFGWQRRVEIALHLAEPLRQKFNPPKGTNPDLLLCALYHRTFIAERPDEVVAELAAAATPPVVAAQTASTSSAPWMAMATRDGR